MPRSKTTPTRHIRIPDDVWEPAKRAAAARGESVTDAVIRALKRYGAPYRTEGEPK
jgi:hypothetical protein